MAWLFNDANTDDVQVTDHAALTFPDADWAVSGWFRINDNSGEDFQYIMSWGAYSANPSWHLYVSETTDVLSLVQNGSVDAFRADSVATPGADTNWHHVLLQRSSGTTSMYLDGSVEADTYGDVGASNVVGNLFLGTRATLPADRYLDGDMAEWAKWDRALSAGEITALAAGYVPDFFPTPIWHVRMWGGEYSELMVPLTVTNDGSDPADHPGGLIYPGRPQLVFPSGAAPPAGIAPTSHLYGSLVGPLGGAI